MGTCHTTGGQQSGGDEVVRDRKVACDGQKVLVGDTVHGGEDEAAQEVSVVDGDDSMGGEDRVGREADVVRVDHGDTAVRSQ